MSSSDNENRDYSRLLWKIAFVLFGLLAVIAGSVLAVRYRNRKESERLLAELAERATEAAQETENTGLNPDELARLMNDGAGDEEDKYIPEAPALNLDWDELRELSPDIYAWISIPDTGVEYPILRRENDDDYWLNHNIDGSYGLPGVIYTENCSSMDFTDPNTVVYGHNMDNTTMFSTLIDFMDEDKFNEPHFIFIYRENEDPLIYEIFAAYEYPAIHLLKTFDFDNEYFYEQYLTDIKNIKSKGYGSANVKKDVDLGGDSRIITLSTCTRFHDASKRFLVTGVLLNDRV